MNKATLILFILIAAAVNTALAQPFAVTTSPRNQNLTGASANYTVTVTAQVGFTASVYLSAHSPTLPGATFSFSPDKINSPYTATSTMTITLTGPKVGGTHEIVIEGKNGPSTTYDTVTVTVTEKPTWRVYDIHNSPLPSNTINAVEIDRDGNAWIGTSLGLARFDGTNWTVFDSSLGFPIDSNTNHLQKAIIGIAIDSSNAVWVVLAMSHAGGTVVKYSGGTWSIVGNYHALSGTIGNKIAADGAGNIWIGADETLARYDGTTWTDYKTDFRIGTVAVDHQGGVWITDIYGTGVDRFDGTYWTSYRGDDIPLRNYRQRGLAVDREGDAWFIDRTGLVEFRGDSLIPYLAREASTIFPGPEPVAMDFDVNGNTWVGSGSGDVHSEPHYGGGLLRYDGTESWHYTIANSGIPDDNVSVVRAASDMSIWIGTQNGGLAVLDGNAAPITLFSSVPGDRSNASLSRMLVGSHPNPTTGRSSAHLVFDRTSHVQMTLMNSMGEEVSTVLERSLEAGEHHVGFSTAGLPAGTYFLRLVSGERIEVEPVVVVR